MKSTGRCHRAKNAGNVMECRPSKKPMLFFRQKRAFIVSIEYEGELPAYARFATSPEIFRVYAVSSGAAQRAAIRDWIDKYQASPRQITKIVGRNAYSPDNTQAATMKPKAI